MFLVSQFSQTKLNLEIIDPITLYYPSLFLNHQVTLLPTLGFMVINI